MCECITHNVCMCVFEYVFYSCIDVRGNILML